MTSNQLSGTGNELHPLRGMQPRLTKTQKRHATTTYKDAKDKRNLLDLSQNGVWSNARPYGQCRAVVWSMQGRVVNAKPYGQCKAVWSMQGPMVNAGPDGQCRAV